MTDLEKEGIAILKQYGFVLRMNKPVCAFLGRVADALGWAEFKKTL